MYLVAESNFTYVIVELILIYERMFEFEKRNPKVCNVIVLHGSKLGKIAIIHFKKPRRL